jgi:hypothetical protein
MADLGPFRRIFRDTRDSLARELAEGNFRPLDIAIRRFQIAVMELQLRDSPNFVTSFVDDPRTRYSAPEMWRRHVLGKAEELVMPSKRDPEKFRQKMDDYLQRGHQMILRVHAAARYYTNHEVITIRENDAAKATITAIAHALQKSANFHQYDFDFLEVSVDAGVRRLLTSERLDLLIALRLATSVPGDVSVMPLPKPAQRPFFVAVIETAISFIPFVGTAVMAYEVSTGQDLFGYKLTDTERGIMAACVFLPMVSRIIKEDRALYSASRMERLYGGTEAQWSRSLAMSERIAAQDKGFIRLKTAQQTLASGGRLSQTAVAEVGDLLEKIAVAKADQAVPSVLSKRAVDAFDALVAHNPRFAELDANAIERIARLGSESKLQGQLLEELGYNRFALWLNDPAGKAALGLEHVAGRIEYIPGYLIRTPGARLKNMKPGQVTMIEGMDGLLVVREGGNQYRVVGVVQDKAGQMAARGLTQGNAGRLTADEMTEVRAYAEDLFRDAQDVAKKNGTPVNTSVDEIIKELTAVRGSGQFASDIERLSSVRFFFGGEEVTLLFQPKQTKFFAVVPSDVNPSKIPDPTRPGSSVDIFSEARKIGISNLEVIGFGVKQKELRDGAEVLAKALGLTKKKKKK